MEHSSKRILLGITGGIAAYRTLELIRLLVQSNFLVKVVATKSALRFVTKTSLECLSRQPILTDDDESASFASIAHIEEARRADLIVVAPATCNAIAKMAHGMADELLYQILLSFNKKVLLAPAMESNMYEHPATQANLRLLKERGIVVLGPEEGALASGAHGLGRMANVPALFDSIQALCTPQDFSGIRCLITAGPTLEPFDPVRFISNRSSGKMGLALARALDQRGAFVDFVHGPMKFSLSLSEKCLLHPVETAQQMHETVMALLPHTKLAIFNAAVCDFRPQNLTHQKLKKDQPFEPEFVRNPDILMEAGKLVQKPFIVGFAAETENHIENALKKCREKNCDLVCLNDISKEQAPFGKDSIQISVIDSQGLVDVGEKVSKDQAAHRILNLVLQRFRKHERAFVPPAETADPKPLHAAAADSRSFSENGAHHK